jgi:hypothetical protein
MYPEGGQFRPCHVYTMLLNAFLVKFLRIEKEVCFDQRVKSVKEVQAAPPNPPPPPHPSGSKRYIIAQKPARSR